MARSCRSDRPSTVFKLAGRRPCRGRQEVEPAGDEEDGRRRAGQCDSGGSSGPGASFRPAPATQGRLARLASVETDDAVPAADRKGLVLRDERAERRLADRENRRPRPVRPVPRVVADRQPLALKNDLNERPGCWEERLRIGRQADSTSPEIGGRDPLRSRAAEHRMRRSRRTASSAQIQPSTSKSAIRIVGPKPLTAGSRSASASRKARCGDGLQASGRAAAWAPRSRRLAAASSPRTPGARHPSEPPQGDVVGAVRERHNRRHGQLPHTATGLGDRHPADGAGSVRSPRRASGGSPARRPSGGAEADPPSCRRDRVHRRCARRAGGPGRGCPVRGSPPRDARLGPGEGPSRETPDRRCALPVGLTASPSRLTGRPTTRMGWLRSVRRSRVVLSRSSD